MMSDICNTFWCFCVLHVASKPGGFQQQEQMNYEQTQHKSNAEGFEKPRAQGHIPGTTFGNSEFFEEGSHTPENVLVGRMIFKL